MTETENGQKPVEMFTSLGRTACGVEFRAGDFVGYDSYNPCLGGWAREAAESKAKRHLELCHTVARWLQEHGIERSREDIIRACHEGVAEWAMTDLKVMTHEEACAARRRGEFD